MNPGRPTFRSGVHGWPAAIAVCVSIGLAFRATAQTVELIDTMFALGVGVGLLAVIGLNARPSFSPVVFVVISAAYVLAIRGRGSVLTLDDPMVWAWVPLTAIALMRPTRSSVDSAEGRTVVTHRGAALLAVVGLTFALIGWVPTSDSLDSTLGGGGGDASDGQGPNDPLALQNGLDMTSRPDLSDKLVFTVEADHPSFWRTATFDVWDGSRWSRSVEDAQFEFVDDPSEQHLGPTLPLTQRYRLEVDARALPAAPNPTSVSVSGVQTLFVGGRDLFTLESLGPGTVYEIESDISAPTLEGLREATGAIPEEVSTAYAQAPQASDRVRELASSLSSPDDPVWAKVEAAEEWLGENTKYSIQAPTASVGSDVVDEFLFETRLGWCEQVASSLVVLLRLQGVPARLATGYVPGERDLNGKFLVRESDAHSWTEVWVPEYGWIPTDPTANVALAGDTSSEDDGFSAALLGALLAALAFVVLFGPPLLRLLRRAWRWVVSRLARRSPRGASRGDVSWVADVERLLDHVGTRLDRPRRPSESNTAYSAELAGMSGCDDLADVGVGLDHVLFGSQLGSWQPDEQLRAKQRFESVVSGTLDSIDSRVAAGVAEMR